MNITEIFIKGRKVSIKKRNSECIEVHSWIIIEKDEFIKLKKLSSERVLYNIESSDDIEMEQRSLGQTSDYRDLRKRRQPDRSQWLHINELQILYS